MSETLIKALMKLFAIIANEGGITDDERSVVENFLKQQINQEAAKEYMQWFEKFAQEEDASHFDAICAQINLELTQKQKVIVMIRLVELVMADGTISPEEEKFVEVVRKTFNMDIQEYMLIRGFVTIRDVQTIGEPDLILVVDKSESTQIKSRQHIRIENLEGFLGVLRIPSVELYVVRYETEHDNEEKIFTGGSGKVATSQELYLNGINMTAGQNYLFTPGSVIRIGRGTPLYYSDCVSQFLSKKDLPKIVFNASDIEFRFKKGNIGLRNITVSENTGKLVGFMGGSGAGKSTLLNVLNGNDTPTKGSVTINGIDIHKQKDKIQGVIGYVSQDDLLIEDLTVYQNLYYNAKLCFNNKTEEELDQLVNKVLTNLGLYETRNLKVGSPLNKTISGGQRKRLNIGLELLREPAVLFADEPTSGLSSRDSENIMDLLKELSLRGKLVFVVIHQPSSDIFKLFDKLLILDVGGYPIYYGNPIEAVAYFKRVANHVNSENVECVECGSVNPEVIFNIIESKVLDEYGNFTEKRKINPEKWHELYTKNVQVKYHEDVSDKPEGSLFIPSMLKQTFVFITRDLLSKISNTQYMFINMLEAPVLALVLAFVVRYFDKDSSQSLSYVFGLNENISSYLFMSIVVALFMGLTVSAEEIIHDRKIQKREQFLNLSRMSYLSSKITLLFFISAIQTGAYILLGNYLLGIQGMNFEYWFILFSTSCFANMLGLNISASFNSAVTIYILIPILLIPQLILSGVIVKFDKLNPVLTREGKVPIIGDLMTSRWAFEALAVSQVTKNEYEKDFYPLNKRMQNADYKRTYWVKSMLNKNTDCERLLESTGDSLRNILKNNLELLRNELIKEMSEEHGLKFSGYNDLTLDSFTKETQKNMRTYLEDVKKYYVGEYNTANDEKQKLISSRTETKEQRDAFISHKEHYYNQTLEDLVTNKLELKYIVERKNNLYRKTGYVYMDPDDPANALDYRTHFYAPRKHIFGRYYDTFWFNNGAIWLESLILFVTLYFESIKKLLDGMSNMAMIFKKKKKK